LSAANYFCKWAPYTDRHSTLATGNETHPVSGKSLFGFVTLANGKTVVTDDIDTTRPYLISTHDIAELASGINERIAPTMRTSTPPSESSSVTASLPSSAPSSPVANGVKRVSEIDDDTQCKSPKTDSESLSDSDDDDASSDMVAYASRVTRLAYPQ
jgi:hypothetical protein